LVDRPHDISSQARNFVDEHEEIRLVVFDPAREQLPARGVYHMRPVEFLADVDARPGLRLHNSPPFLATGLP
jgi:hypothetical protein